ncbi:hypothetical protein I7I50_04880 [Histoplasma capsulatum G186AR]|uniref:Uncharacterized protein n=1 Tax=Ajellomyces capsulatus TaxID=5037 RepID=A0A8H8D7Q9_AJECA|nr:hypothetical protein I7I52_03138 [Histoplasma capsulatum]QSS75670.1 hypothetical protein I7I50_04880 [Histoplasma capsulatum G186AR]
MLVCVLHLTLFSGFCFPHWLMFLCSFAFYFVSQKAITRTQISPADQVFYAQKITKPCSGSLSLQQARVFLSQDTFHRGKKA